MPVAALTCLRESFTSGFTPAGRVLGVEPPAHRRARVELDLAAGRDARPGAGAAGGRVDRVDGEPTALAGVARSPAGGLHDHAQLELLVVPVGLGLQVEPALAVGLVLVDLLPARRQLLLQHDDALLALLALDLAVDVGRGAVDGGRRGPVDLLELRGHPAGREWLFGLRGGDRRRPGHQGQEGDHRCQGDRSLVGLGHHHSSLVVSRRRVLVALTRAPAPRNPCRSPLLVESRHAVSVLGCRIRWGPFVAGMSEPPGSLRTRRRAT